MCLVRTFLDTILEKTTAGTWLSSKRCAYHRPCLDMCSDLPCFTSRYCLERAPFDVIELARGGYEALEQERRVRHGRRRCEHRKCVPEGDDRGSPIDMHRARLRMGQHKRHAVRGARTPTGPHTSKRRPGAI